MATNVTTSTLSNEMAIYYETVFLARAKLFLVYQEGAQKKTLQNNVGKTVYFTRYSPLSINTTPMTEGSNPSQVSLSEATVSAVASEYGAYAQISKFLSLTSIDKNNKEKIEVFGQNMGETLDTIVRETVVSGATTQLAGGVSALSSIAASNTMSSAEIRKAVATLEEQKAMKYDDGFWLGKLVPQSKYDFTGDSTWVNAKTYSDVKDLYTNEMGELHGVRLLLSNNPHTDASTVTVYSNLIHGAQSFGTIDLENDAPQLYVKISGPQDTSNPANRYSTISWAGNFTSVVLNPNWIVNVKTAASIS